MKIPTHHNIIFLIPSGWDGGQRGFSFSYHDEHMNFGNGTTGGDGGVGLSNDITGHILMSNLHIVEIDKMYPTHLL